jgi:hypothetical protein
MNFKSDKKIELMMGILAMIYLIDIMEGLIKNQSKPIPIKKYKNGKTYLSIYVFRIGLATIQHLFKEIYQLICYLETHSNSSTANEIKLTLIKNV